MSAPTTVSLIAIAGGLLFCAPAFSAPPEHFSAEDTNIHVVVVTNSVTNETAIPTTSKTRLVSLNVGEIKEIYRYDKKEGKPVKSFYLPPEATELVQLVVEKKGGVTTYFLKAHRSGKTVGGVVERDWLDEKGFTHKDITELARIQKAVKDAPYIITINP